MEIDILRVIEFFVALAFGFTGFLYTIYSWSEKNITTTVIFAIFFFVMILVVVNTYALLRDKTSKGKDGDR